MKKLYFVVLMLTAISVNCQKTMRAEDIVKKFYATYDLSGSSYPRVHFEKRMGNWYVRTISFDKDTPKYGQALLFFDKSMFQKLPFAESETTEETIDPVEYLDEPTLYNFNVQPCYNYAGWYNDVIGLYSGKKILTDDELYALGRAYSNKATAKVTNQFDDVDPKDKFDLPPGSYFTKLQEDDFIKTQDSAINCFTMLAERNPHIETIVGSIRTKLANEVMAKFHTLLTFTPHSWEKIQLPADLFPDSTQHFWKQLLNACTANSIFLSFGDNDFYPILFLQYSQKIRPDIYLIHYSLLGSGKFIYRATLPQFGAKGIRLNVDTSTYKSNINEFIRLNTTATSGIMDIPSLITTLKSAINTKEPVTLASNHFRLIRNKKSMDFFVDGNYLLKNEWILLNMLSNDPRPVYSRYYFPDALKTLNIFWKKDGSLLVM